MMKKSMSHVCPNCMTAGMSIFYKAKNVPVNSCMMFSNHDEAVSFPKGDVVLGFCDTCGFISNVAFDPSRLDYASLAPEEQGFSGHLMLTLKGWRLDLFKIIICMTSMSLKLDAAGEIFWR